MTELFAKLGSIVWYTVVLGISILGLTQALKFITCMSVWKDFLKTLETSMKDNESISIRISCKRDIKESSAAWTFLNPGFFYSVLHGIQSECEKIRTRKNSGLRHFSHSAGKSQRVWFLVIPENILQKISK